MQVLGCILLVFCLKETTDAALTLKGAPTRTDTIVLDENAGPLLAELAGATVLDTGLTITPAICDIPDAATLLQTTFGQLREVRGTITASSASCVPDLKFLSKLVVVRADMVPDDAATGIELTGLTASSLPASLRVVGSSNSITVDGSTVALPASSCDASCSTAGCKDGGSNTDCCPAACLGGCSADGSCHACADGKLQAADGSCAATCPSGTLSYGFSIHNIDTWEYDDGGVCKSKVTADTVCGPGTCGGGWGRVDARRYCVAACPDDAFESDGECVSHCPGMAKANSDRKCPSGFTGSVCDVHFDVRPPSDDGGEYAYAYEGTTDDSFYDDDQVNVGDENFMKDSFGFEYAVVQSLCHVEVMHGLAGCEIFHGGVSLNKLSASIKQDIMVDAFGSVTTITGSVKVYQTLFTSLDFWSNVVSIGKCDTDTATPEPRCNHVALDTGKYAIKISENPYMTSLSLNQLRRVGGPGAHGPTSPIYVKDNEGLCLIDSIAWGELSAADLPVGENDGSACGLSTLSNPCQLGFTLEFLTSDRARLAIEGYDAATKDLFKESPVHPVTCGTTAKKCASLCGDRGCWDFSETGCQLCPNAADVVQAGVCVSGGCESGDPSPGYFEAPEAPGICKPCHESCDDCTGETEKDCTKCVGDGVLLKSGQCGEECPKGEYADTNRVCKDCRDECTECTSYDECTACDVTQKWYLNFPPSTMQCVKPTECPAGTYPADNTALCTQCDESCGTCDAGGPASCLSCAGEYPIFFEEYKRCYQDCPGSAYTDYTDPNNLSCGICNANCAKCFGRESTQCTECAENTLEAVDFPDRSSNAGAVECYNAAECPVGKYADFSTEKCERCSDDCHTCSGAKMFNALFCTRCQNEQYLNPVGWDCVGTCPAEHYGVVPSDVKLAGADSVCDECTQCTDGTLGDGSVQQYATTDCTHDTDRVCTPCEVCTFPAEFYVTRCSEPNAANGRDAVCGAVTSKCPLNHFQTAEPTEDSDRQCQRMTTCEEFEAEYETVAPTEFSDRVCLKTTTCVEGKQFENKSWTAKSNRECADLTECNVLSEYQLTAETKDSDRVCTDLTVCKGALAGIDGEYESQAATPDADRTCAACDPCPAGKAKSAGCDGILNTQCVFADKCSGFNPCVHKFSDEGECNTINGTQIVCTCSEGYKGEFCELRDSVCVEDTTCGNNGATCTPTGLDDGDFECTCAEGFSGKLCEIDASVCTRQGSLCQNDATCASTGLTDDDFSCSCVAPWTGTKCQFDKTICDEAVNMCTRSGYAEGECYVDIKADSKLGEPEAICNCKPLNASESQTACGDFCERQFDGTVCTDVRLDGSTMKADKKMTSTVGGVAGAFVFLALLVAVIAFLYARKHIKKNEQYEAFKKGEAIPADEWEIVPRDLLTIGQQIGSGNFGLVNKGMYMDPTAEVDKAKTMFAAATDVAVKTLKITDIDYGVMDEAGGTKVNLDDPRHRAAAKEFFDEMDLMKEIGSHQNVVNLIGVCTQERPYLIVIEFCGEGDLRGFLQKRRAKGGKQQQVDRNDMLSYAIQVAHGMEHLSVKHRIVHRDLAARNVLVKKVGGVDVMKVSDFGLARDVYEEDFYQKSENGVMAIKWMSPEALCDRIFTTKGDVWSYGIVMWEIATLGYMPYPGHQNHQIETIINEGYRMPYPQTCAGKDYYSVTLKCWEYEEDARPTFSQIKAQLIQMSGFKLRDLKKILGEAYDPDQDDEGATPGIYADVNDNNNTLDDGEQGETYLEPSVRGSVDNSPEPNGSWGGAEESFQLGPASARGVSKRTSEDLANFQAMTLQGHEQAVYDNSLPRNSDGMVNTAEMMYDDGNAGEMYDMADTGGYLDTRPTPGAGGAGMVDADAGGMYDMAANDGEDTAMYSEASAAPPREESYLQAMQDGNPNDMYDMAENDGEGMYDAGMPGTSPQHMHSGVSQSLNSGGAFFGGVSDLAGRPASAVYVETQMSDGNAGGLYDTADNDDDAGAISAPIRRASSGPHSIAEHSFITEVVATNGGGEERPASLLSNATYAQNPKLVTSDTADVGGAGSMRNQRAETVWEPIDMDPKSSSFRLKSVRRSNPLITPVMNVENL